MVVFTRALDSGSLYHHDGWDCDIIANTLFSIRLLPDSGKYYAATTRYRSSSLPEIEFIIEHCQNEDLF